MDVGQFLSNPENREAVKAIAARVLAEVAPVEAEVAPGLIEPLIELAGRDEVVIVDLWNEPGRFGNAALLLPLLVPLLSKALARAASGGPSAITREELKAMIVRTRSTQGRRRIDEVERVINLVLAENASEGARFAG